MPRAPRTSTARLARAAFGLVRIALTVAGRNFERLRLL